MTYIYLYLYTYIHIYIYIYHIYIYVIYIFRLGKNHCPLVSLEEYKYVIKRNKIPKYITDNIEFFSDNSDKEDSDYSD